METIFLIGGSGFIGKNLAVYLSREYNVCIYDKFIDTLFFEDYPQISTYQMDLVEEQIPLDVNAPEYIINLASIVTAERNLSLFDSLISSNLKILLAMAFNLLTVNSTQMADGVGLRNTAAIHI